MGIRRASRTSRTVVIASLCAMACAEPPVDANNNFTAGSDVGTSETADGESGEDGTGTGDSTDDSTGDGDGDGDSSTGDGDGDTTTESTDTSDTDTAGPCVTPIGEVGASCGEADGIKGPVTVGQSIDGLPFGGIEGLDNGEGAGEEDWYQVQFPLDVLSPRPLAGTPTITFTINDDDDYRFEVYRDCGAEAFGQGLAAEFGAESPPVTEWTFGDLDPGGVEQLDYMEMVTWPETVWVRVFRFQNDGACSSYQLSVTRP